MVDIDVKEDDPMYRFRGQAIRCDTFLEHLYDEAARYGNNRELNYIIECLRLIPAHKLINVRDASE